MTKLLTLFQIKTIRSAWVFLIGSVLMFLFGAYQAFVPLGDITRPADQYYEIGFFSLWFILCGLYIAVASWALFSEKGRNHVKAQELTLTKIPKGPSWYVKFFFACYAAAFATLMLVGIAVLPFTGYAGIELMASPNRGIYFLAAGLIWAPLIFKYLK